MGSFITWLSLDPYCSLCISSSANKKFMQQIFSSTLVSLSVILGRYCKEKIRCWLILEVKG